MTHELAAAAKAAQDIEPAVEDFAEATGLLEPVRELTAWLAEIVHYRRAAHKARLSMRAAARIRETGLPARAVSDRLLRAVLDAQRRQRDRFLFALLFGTGMRVGQALGLRHEDFVGHRREVRIVPREDNVNRARGKGGRGCVPITSELVRLYSGYMHEEYGDLDFDYVFVNLWAGRIGRPMSYASVEDLVRRTRPRVGFYFTAHMFRHTYASMARAGGVPLEVVSKILTQAARQHAA